MVRIAQIQLLPDERQAKALRDTLLEANSACNEISSVAFETQTFPPFSLHKITYQAIRTKYALSSQQVIRCISKVADSYKKNKERQKGELPQRTYRPLGAIAYDDRILSFQSEESRVSIRTTLGREKIPYVGGTHQVKMLAFRKGESDLCVVKGKWYLNVACELPVAEREQPLDLIGVDLGIKRLATTSAGASYTGDGIERKRRWYLRRRRVLQQVGTKSAKRRLKKLKGKERKFRKDTNHRISKEIVAAAKGTRQGIVMEDLKGIRRRATVHKKQRAKFSGWSFNEMRRYITYKAEAAGVVVVSRNPRYTSQCPSKCLHTREKEPSFTIRILLSQVWSQGSCRHGCGESN